MFQEGLSQNGLGSADVHSEYLVSEPRVSEGGQALWMRPTKGMMFYFKIKAVATSKIMDDTVVILCSMVTSLASCMKM